MSDDVLHIKRVAMNLPNLDFNQDIFDEAICDLNRIVLSLTGKQITEFQLTLPSNINEQNILESERSYDKNALLVTVAKNVPRLNSDQTIVYNEIIASVEQKEGRMFFLDAPGGTGKTFLINLLLAKVRSSGGIAIAVASSGIAATLLDGGKTAHSTFKLPLKTSGKYFSVCSICNISKQSNIAKLMQDCSLIVWDEATMAHKVSIEALDKSLRDLRNNNKPMGSCTVLFSGDFRQTLPIVVRGTRADEIDACLKKSHLWPQIKSVTLKKNMRLSLCPDNKNFANKLLDIGNGKIISDRGLIRIDESLCVPVNDLEELIKNVFPCIDNISQKKLIWFQERAILSSTNEQVNVINEIVQSKFISDTKCYYSVDTVIDTDQAVHFPTKFLNSLSPPGLPPHKLILKLGSPIILLRNLNPPKLCNGTRLIITSLKNYLLECQIITGCGTGEKVLIPRIPLIPSDLPFEFKRIQFPVKLCYSMTINKAQGQTLKVVGLDLSVNCFSHGQLYVAMSRVISKQNLYILAPNKKTANVVYNEVI